MVTVQAKFKMKEKRKNFCIKNACIVTLLNLKRDYEDLTGNAIKPCYCILGKGEKQYTHYQIEQS